MLDSKSVQQVTVQLSAGTLDGTYSTGMLMKHFYVLFASMSIAIASTWRHVLMCALPRFHVVLSGLVMDACIRSAAEELRAPFIIVYSCHMGIGT